MVMKESCFLRTNRMPLIQIDRNQRSKFFCCYEAPRNIVVEKIWTRNKAVTLISILHEKCFGVVFIGLSLK